MRGRAASLNDGKYLCPTPPYGYKRIKLAREKGWSLEIIPREAEVVRLVFQKYAQEQESLSAIAAQLNAMGIATRKGGPWQPNTLRQMLKNPIYDGKIWWGKRNPTKRDNKPPTILPGRHEAILNPNLYEEAQKRFGAQSPPPTKALQNPLAGLVYCADCGKAMLRLPHAKGERPDQLYCRTKSCANVASYLYIVEQKTLAALENWVAAYSLDLTGQDSGEIESQQQRIAAQSQAALDQEIKAKQEQLDNTYNLLEQGLYTPALFEERQKILTAQIAGAEKQRRELGAELAQLAKAAALWETPKPLWPESQLALACYSQLKDPKAKNELLKVIIGKIEYKKTPDHKGPDDFTLKIYPRVPRI